MPRTHAVDRGLEQTGGLRSFEGRFGRMFPSLPAADFAGRVKPADGRDSTQLEEVLPAPHTRQSADDVLEALATRMVEKSVTKDGPIPAGYTFLGQFIDHDLTFDPASSLQRDSDPGSIVDYRTPRFDLDCVYGRGPSDGPEATVRRHMWLDRGRGACLAMLIRMISPTPDNLRTCDC